MEFLKHIIRQEISAEKDNFLIKTQKVVAEPRGILNNEALFLWAITKLCRPSIIFESGVYRGRSTEILSLCASEFGAKTVLSYDISTQWEKHCIEKFSQYENIQYQNRSSIEAALELPKEEKIVCFLDGPKYGDNLLSLMKNLSNKNIEAILCHDCILGAKTRKTFDIGYRYYKKNYNIIYLNHKYINSDINAKILNRDVIKDANFENCANVGLIIKKSYGKI